METNFSSYLFYLLIAFSWWFFFSYLPESFTRWNFMPAVVFLTFYWFYSGLSLYGDHHPSSWIGKHKSERRDTIKDYQLLPYVVFNQMMMILIVNVLYIPYCGRGWLKFNVPSLPWTFFEVFLYFLFYDLFFYYGHRFLHLPAIYPIHKLHHMTFGTVGISGMYMHPIDAIFEIVMPGLMGPLIFNGHVVSVTIVTCLGAINSSHSHSGYSLPFLPSYKAHYAHHTMFNKNFGVGIFDRIHNTRIEPNAKQLNEPQPISKQHEN